MFFFFVFFLSPFLLSVVFFGFLPSHLLSLFFPFQLCSVFFSSPPFFKKKEKIEGEL